MDDFFEKEGIPIRRLRKRRIMQYFKDKSGRYFVQLENGIVARVESANTSEMQEVSAPELRPTEYKITLVSKSVCNLDEVMKTDWHLKDSIVIPCADGNEYEFIVEHVTESSTDSKTVYFVSKDIVGKSSMLEINNFLDEFEACMPAEFVQMMNTIEHKSKNGFEMKRKLNLLSYGNVCKNTNCSGSDDMLFDGLKTEAERVKNYKGETAWYWLATMHDSERSPSVGNSYYFMYVYAYGNAGNYSNANYMCGVVPGFSISIKNSDIKNYKTTETKENVSFF